MTLNASLNRRLRIDRAASLAAAAAAGLVLLTAMLLLGYLLLSVAQLFRSQAPQTVNALTIGGLSWTPSAVAPSAMDGTLDVDVRNGRTALLFEAGELVALDLDNGAQLPVDLADEEVRAKLSAARDAHILQWTEQRLLLLDAVSGVGVLQWSRSAAPASVAASNDPTQPENTADDRVELRAHWAEFPELMAERRREQPSSSTQLLHAALAGTDDRLRLLTLWQQAAQTELRWHALRLTADAAPQLRLLRQLPLDSIRLPAAGTAAEQTDNASLLAADITSLLPDQTGGAYLGLSSGMLLHVGSDAAAQAEPLHAPPDAAVVALIGLNQAGVLVAHADGHISEFTRAEADQPQLVHRYACAGNELAAIAVDPKSGWLACVGADLLQLFYLGRPDPVWQFSLDQVASRESKAMLAIDTAQLLLAQSDVAGKLRVNSWQLAADPVVDMQTLWWPQHYQGEAQASWQWEPQPGSQARARLSLLPLLSGTFKAALLGMLIALPLSLLGAVYTALLLPQRWRERIKPMVEMLESLPTVILGFIGALWLAPLLQQHLLSLWLLLLLMPLTLALTGYYWSSTLKLRVAAAFRGVFPYLLFALQLLLLFALGMLLQQVWFGGSFSAWLETAAGWTYDLHNALLVGLVLGLGIAPSIFALVEDALAAVPRRLQLASLALGASRWQTVWQVMLPAASAGILAAVLIGFGRALGETMIVLMVSSNTPIMESSLLRGLQAIAPTLASEMSEASPDSVHFRVLLFAALVLFGFTFVMNSLAEVFRTRLRRRYQS
ncbi:MAG: ABC transporter permease subunit [Gammaproteobacteria bacterium]|nr:ABC transporter permease subunit [Gammaproteobacteria bacterium]